jgi:queuine tRNA-ribosyltransferase
MPAGRTCSKAYLRHLVISGEMLGAMLASLHNLCFYMWLMEQARQKIAEGEFSPWKDRMIKQLSRRL